MIYKYGQLINCDKKEKFVEDAENIAFWCLVYIFVISIPIGIYIYYTLKRLGALYKPL